MTKYFDKTFFKFLIGFVVIIAVSFSIVILANYLGINSDFVESQQAQNMQSLETHTQSVDN